MFQTKYLEHKNILSLNNAVPRTKSPVPVERYLHVSSWLNRHQWPTKWCSICQCLPVLHVVSTCDYPLNYRIRLLMKKDTTHLDYKIQRNQFGIIVENFFLMISFHSTRRSYTWLLGELASIGLPSYESNEWQYQSAR